MKVDKIVKQFLTPVRICVSFHLQGSSYSQLYIPLNIINEFKEDYKPWEKRDAEGSEDVLPPITLFDKVAKVVLESIRKVFH